jgi:PEGA domain-containing protein/collagen triple helix repeat protein
MRFKSFLIALLLWPAFAVSQTTVDDGHQVIISSFPNNAHVLIDGVDTGQMTPMVLHKIAPGQHVITVSVEAPGWNTSVQTINVLDVDQKGNPRDTQLSFTLVPTVTTGPQGVIGLTGATGPVGPQGPAGAGGTIGPGGITGPHGPAGPQGLPGIAGAAGPAGPAGLPGPTGANGATGLAGANGVDGAIGSQGPMGLSIIGPVGPVGPQGVPGLQGAQGPAGAGIAGPQGPAGPQGLPGPQGYQGTNGANGADGLAGPAGAPGANATPIYAGVWSPSRTYTIGQEVIRDPSVGGSAGPFFNLTGVRGTDPAADLANWVYCCGTAVLGYQPLALSGSIQGSYPAGSSTNLLTHTFNVDETKIITTLTA